jgi:hypothetical protein
MAVLREAERFRTFAELAARSVLACAHGPRDVAFNSGRTGSSFTPTAWAVFAGGVIVFLILAGVLVFFSFRATFRESSGPKFNGPALTGTARVLRRDSTNFMRNNKYMLLIGLRVEVPGRQPYDVTVRHPVHPLDLFAVEPGRTVAVQADSANPLNVRIDLSQPIQRGPQAGSPGSTEQVADQLKAALEEKLKQIPGVIVASDNSGSSGSPPTVAALADAYKQSRGSVPVVSAADLLAADQRVRGALKSFAATGTTPRSLGRTPSRPELLDAPHYMLEVELQFPNLAPVTGRAVQPVPPPRCPTSLSAASSRARSTQLTQHIDSPWTGATSPTDQRSPAIRAHWTQWCHI